MNAKAKQAMFNLRDDLKTSVPTNSTIVVNRSDLEAVVKYLFNNGEEWNNQAALGYAIAAAERIWTSDIFIKQFIGAMEIEFDERNLESAAEYYRESDY
ncbi:hypothetical protein [Sporosarcina sp. FA9]|uniref:hypothetical protein n=1 Tax=Sporosarcina sp. FA9 TaxID=3413030 RepID=UPI003F65E0C5